MAKRSYFEEVQEIAQTWNSVKNSKINFSEIERSWISGNAFCVGSGGALSLAKLWQNVHESNQLGIAKTMTPYEFHFTNSKPDLVVLFSASGKNHDILDVFRTAIDRGSRVLIFTATERSKLVKLAKSHSSEARVIYPNCKTPQDGFLAVNSTVAMSCLVAKFQDYVWGQGNLVDSPIDTAVSDHQKQCSNVQDITGYTAHIISAGWGAAAGLDFEARMAESGLAPCFLTDPRNFGHGRFLWLEKQLDKSLILFLYNNDSKSLINRIDKLIPVGVEKFKICAPFQGVQGAIYCLVRSILLFGEFAKYSDSDPGMPFVPEWGKKLHRLKAENKQLKKSENQKVTNADEKYPAQRTSFSGVVFDFDGTIVDTKDRFLPIGEEILYHFERLLELGLRIGVATGRGSSAYKALKDKIAERHHENVVVGLYNGSIINNLVEDIVLTDNCWHLKTFIDHLLDKHEIVKTKVSSRPTQISIRDIKKAEIERIIDYLRVCLGQHSQYVKFLRSAHSLDIIPFWASKINLVQFLCSSLDSKILCIGDQGQVGGNDEELLVWQPSVSVGSKQPISNNCYWIGRNSQFRESKGTLEILKNIELENGSFRLKKNTLVR